jgi:cytoskeletal protein CcmA (bactofilin family)
VEEGAKILANVRAGNALISGQIKGNMKVDDRLELTSTAQILGDISCATLVMAAGALLSGKVIMKGISIEAPKTERRGILSRVRTTTEDEGEGAEGENQV